MGRSGIRDGFIRSVGDRASGAPSISTAQSPEAITALLDSTGWETSTLMAEAKDLLAFKTRHGLTQINGASAPALPTAGQRLVLVETSAAWATDTLPGADLVAAAQRDHPGAEIVVRDETSAPLDLATLTTAFAAVYTAGGLLGLEAVLAGVPVTCLGEAFYAGRGLTNDRIALTRRARSVIEVFAAAYLHGSQYTDPLTGKVCEPRKAFERMAAFKRHAERTAGDWRLLNIAPAKRGVIRAFLNSPMGRGEKRALAWASRPNDAVRHHQNYTPGQLTYVEDGFIRSSGLGAAFAAAQSLVLDRGGIYYDPESGSDLEALLNTADFDEALLQRAARLRELIVGHHLSKYNLKPAAALAVTARPGQHVILVPGQVENDASVLKGGGGLGNLALLQRVRQASPGAHIVYKAHPDVAAGLRPGHLGGDETSGLADQIADDVDILDAISQADEIHTLTSLTGFEALLRGKSVTTYGWPFYAGWGLTEDKGPAPGPSRRPVSLDALVAAALILYPLYLDPVSGLPCDPETLLQRLAEQGPARPPSRLSPVTRYFAAARTMLNPPKPKAY